MLENCAVSSHHLTKVILTKIKHTPLSYCHFVLFGESLIHHCLNSHLLQNNTSLRFFALFFGVNNKTSNFFAKILSTSEFSISCAGNRVHSTQTIGIFTVKTMVKRFFELFCYDEKLLWRQKS